MTNCAQPEGFRSPIPVEVAEPRLRSALDAQALERARKNIPGLAAFLILLSGFEGAGLSGAVPSGVLLGTVFSSAALIGIATLLRRNRVPAAQGNLAISAAAAVAIFEIFHRLYVWLFRVFSGCPVDPCAIMQFLWDRYRPLRSSLAADRAPASHKSLITFMLA